MGLGSDTNERDRMILDIGQNLLVKKSHIRWVLE